MLKLPEHSLKDIESIYKEIRVKVIEQKNKSTIMKRIKRFLSDDNIDKILFSKPNELEPLLDDLFGKMGSNYNKIEYRRYLKILKKRNKNDEENDLIKKYSRFTDNLSSIFNYDKLISNNKPLSYNLAKLISCNTCTYCNRQYTFTVIKKDIKTGNVNNKTRITRPEFDHWISKKKYPLFALSFYNLIPSCSICNSTIKGELDFSLKTHIHPYIQDENETFKFTYQKKGITENEVDIKYSGNKINKTLTDLKINAIYNEHKDYELQDILDLRFKYSDNYLTILFNKTFDLSEVNKKDAYRMLFGVEIDPKDFHKRPMSKFKYDILKELGIIG